jgi:hypothetical protein
LRLALRHKRKSADALPTFAFNYVAGKGAKSNATFQFAFVFVVENAIAFLAREQDNSSTTLKCISVGVHLANVSVLGKALYVALLLGFVHFLFQRLTGLNIPLVKPKLGVKDNEKFFLRLLTISLPFFAHLFAYQRKVRAQGDGVTLPASLAVRKSVVVEKLIAVAQLC